MPAEPTALYRIFGDADLLLYIGISKDFGRRWKEEAKTFPWWPERRWMTVDWYDSREEAEAAEEAAIKAESPVHNKVHAVPRTIQPVAASSRSARPRVRSAPISLADLGSFPIPIGELLALPVTVDIETAARALGVPADQACALITTGRFPVEVKQYDRRPQNWHVTRASIFRKLGLDPLLIAADAA